MKENGEPVISSDGKTYIKCKKCRTELSAPITGDNKYFRADNFQKHLGRCESKLGGSVVEIGGSVVEIPQVSHIMPYLMFICYTNNLFIIFRSVMTTICYLILKVGEKIGIQKMKTVTF